MSAMGTSFFSDLLSTIAERGRAVLHGSEGRRPNGSDSDPAELARALISGRGEASGVALAREILLRWQHLDGNGRRDFLLQLATEFGPDLPELEAAIAAWRKTQQPSALQALHKAAEPRRQEVIRRLNLAPRGTEQLVRMREELFRHQKRHEILDLLDEDFVHLFGSWFNPGFLVLRRIEWSTPANILERIIRYEAVHAIRDWNDLRRRIEPGDRRLFAFFHPQMVDDPLIFVEVALTDHIPDAIEPLLAEGREAVPVSEATTAVFYSISTCQIGLRGVSFGSFLIKQVVEDLKRELPGLTTFTTLSPVPGFASWLEREQASREPSLAQEDLRKLAALDPTIAPDAALKEPLFRAAASYLLTARNAEGKPLDPVARFHLGNGARLERLNFLGDASPRGLTQSHGLMVNYLYDLDRIERNHEAYAETGQVAAASAVRRHVKSSHRVSQSADQRIETAS